MHSRCRRVCRGEGRRTIKAEKRPLLSSLLLPCLLSSKVRWCTAPSPPWTLSRPRRPHWRRAGTTRMASATPQGRCRPPCPRPDPLPLLLSPRRTLYSRGFVCFFVTPHDDARSFLPLFQIGMHRLRLPPPVALLPAVGRGKARIVRTLLLHRVFWKEVEIEICLIPPRTSRISIQL